MTTPSTISYRRGDIVLVSFPFTDLTFAKRRPALGVSPDILNEINEDLILLAITSQLSPFPHSIPVLPGTARKARCPRNFCEADAEPQEIRGKRLMSGTYLVKSAVLWVSSEGIP
jgi:hypothetical protein